MSVPKVKQRVGRRRVGGAVIAAACLLAFLAGPTQASAAKAPSQLGLLMLSSSGPSTGIFGLVNSDKSKCLAGRKVEFTIIYPTKEKVFDVAKTSRNGGFFARAEEGAFDGADGVRLRVDAKRIGKGKSALRCGADKLESI